MNSLRVLKEERSGGSQQVRGKWRELRKVGTSVGEEVKELVVVRE